MEFIAEPDIVLLNCSARTGEDAVRTLHQRLTFATDALLDPPRFLSGLLQRMREAPVAIADEIALPHARTDAVRRLVFAVGRTSDGVAFDAAHPNVRLIFLIGTPQGAVAEYLRVVAALTRFLRPPATRQALLAATDEAEFRALLSSGVSAPR